MDKIQEIIRTFSKDDSEGFKNFINRLKKKNSRKDLELFDILNAEKEYKREELLSILYKKDKNMEAYHATRKRLVRQLADFIHYKKINETDNNESKALSLYYLSQHLFESKKDQIAWSYVKKAEQIAENQKLFSILHKIYLLQLEYSNSIHAEPFPAIIRRKKLNLEKLIKTDDIITAKKVIKNRLTEVLIDKEDFHIEMLIKNVIADHELGNAVDEDFDFLFSIIKTVEEVVEINQNYDAFERYIISTYNEFKDSIGKKDYNKHLEILYIICHTLFMNKKFVLAEKYIQDLEEKLHEASAQNFAHYSSNLLTLKSKMACYSGKTDLAIEYINTFLAQRDKHSKHSVVNLELLYSYLHLLRGDFEKINSTLELQFHSDEWCMKVAGKTWAIKKKILEAILAFEQKDLKEFDTIVRMAQRTLKVFLDEPENAFWKELLQLFNKVEARFSQNMETEFLGEIITLKKSINKMYDNLEANILFSWFEAKCTHKEVQRTIMDLHATAI